MIDFEEEIPNEWLYLKRNIQHVINPILKIPLDVKWKVAPLIFCTQQENTKDCGICVCVNLRRIIKGEDVLKEINSSDERDKILREIIGNCNTILTNTSEINKEDKNAICRICKEKDPSALKGTKIKTGWTQCDWYINNI